METCVHDEAMRVPLCRRWHGELSLDELLPFYGRFPCRIDRGGQYPDSRHWVQELGLPCQPAHVARRVRVLLRVVDVLRVPPASDSALPFLSPAPPDVDAQSRRTSAAHICGGSTVSAVACTLRVVADTREPGQPPSSYVCHVSCKMCTECGRDSSHTAANSKRSKLEGSSPT
jgi:hypothetical protein